MATTKASNKKGGVWWFGREIELTGIYYLYFPDNVREMSQKEREEYDKMSSWPEKMKYQGLLQLSPDKNPNVLPVKGSPLIEMEDRDYIPQFDRFFDEVAIIKYLGRVRVDDKRYIPKPTKRLTLLPAEGMEFYRDHSFMLNDMFGKRR